MELAPPYALKKKNLVLLCILILQNETKPKQNKTTKQKTLPQKSTVNLNSLRKDYGKWMSLQS